MAAMAVQVDSQAVAVAVELLLTLLSPQVLAVQVVQVRFALWALHKCISH
jgi:hypothetical protein